MSVLKKNLFIDFVQAPCPIHAVKSTAGGIHGFVDTDQADDAQDGDELLMQVGEHLLEYHCIAANSIQGFQKVATGYRVPVDAIDKAGIELGTGILAQSPGAFVVGTDPAFHAALRFVIDDLVDFELLGIGFRNHGDYVKHQDGVLNAGITDVAYIGIYGDTTSDGSIYTVTELANAGLSDEDTTEDVVGSSPCELRVNVSAAGVVTFQLDLAASATPSTPATLVAPDVTQTFTFADGDTVVPFVVVLKGDEVADGVLDFLKLDIGHDDL